MSIPQHIAIIMDGNGRWAKAKGWERSRGHEAGVQAVHRITELCSQKGVRFLTLYAFSTENWNRPDTEVAALMSLIITSMEEELFMRNNVRLQLIGDIDRLPTEVRQSILGTVERTSGNTGLTVVIALSYSSKWELTTAMRTIAQQVKEGTLDPAQITEDIITQHLNTATYPDPELLIRTGGEVRMSNFLLWQAAYSELYFCDTFWPDFGAKELEEALQYYRRRERRFGLTSEQLTETTVF